MDKKQFKDFCKKEFESQGFKKHKNMFYLTGRDLLCGIYLQKSNFGDVYYVNFYYFIGTFDDVNNFPTRYEYDVYERILVMSKKQTFQGKKFMTAQVEYEEYTEDELRPYFDKEFENRILPPVRKGKKHILDNLGTLYSLTLRKEEVMKKLQS